MAARLKTYKPDILPKTLTTKKAHAVYGVRFLFNRSVYIYSYRFSNLLFFGNRNAQQPVIQFCLDPHSCRHQKGKLTCSLIHSAFLCVYKFPSFSSPPSSFVTEISNFPSSSNSTPLYLFYQCRAFQHQ